MSHAIVAGQRAYNRVGAFEDSASKEIQDNTCNGSFVLLTGTADALPFPGNVAINAAGVDAITLATPKAGNQPLGDDGKTVFVVDENGAAHTITTAADGIINSKHLLTFNGTIGSNVTLKALNGVWIVVAADGVAITS